MNDTLKRALLSNALIFALTPCTVVQSSAPGFDPASMGIPANGSSMPNGQMSQEQLDAEFERLFVAELEKAMSDPAYAQQLQKQGEEELRRAKEQGMLDVYADALSMLTGQPVSVADLEQAIAEFDQPTQPQPVQPAQPSMPQPTIPAPTQPQPAQPTQPTVSAPAAELRSAVQGILSALESLRQKGVASPVVGSELAAFSLEIQDVLVLLNAINTPQHLQRLTEATYAKLVKQLISFSKQLTPLERSILIPADTIALENPYTTLGVTLFAPQSEVDAAYNRLKQEKSPEVVSQRLQARNIPARDRERELKSARIIWNEIQDAYDQLRTPAERKRIDETVQREITAQRSRMSQSLRQLDQIKQLLTQTIYNDGLVTALAAFVKDYEPAQHALHQQLEKERAAREEEQRRRAQQVPIRTPGSVQERFETGTYRGPSGESGSSSGGRFDSFGGFPGGYDDSLDGLFNRGAQKTDEARGVEGGGGAPTDGEKPTTSSEKESSPEQENEQSAKSGDVEDAVFNLSDAVELGLQSLKSAKLPKEPTKPGIRSTSTTEDALQKARKELADLKRLANPADKQKQSTLEQTIASLEQELAEARTEQQRAMDDTRAAYAEDVQAFIQQESRIGDIAAALEDVLSAFNKSGTSSTPKELRQARTSLATLVQTIRTKVPSDVQPKAVIDDLEKIEKIVEATLADPKKARSQYLAELRRIKERNGSEGMPTRARELSTADANAFRENLKLVTADLTAQAKVLATDTAIPVYKEPVNNPNLSALKQAVTKTTQEIAQLQTRAQRSEQQETRLNELLEQLETTQVQYRAAAGIDVYYDTLTKAVYDIPALRNAYRAIVNMGKAAQSANLKPVEADIRALRAALTSVEAALATRLASNDVALESPIFQDMQLLVTILDTVVTDPARAARIAAQAPQR